MSEWMRGSRAACARFAPTLALLDDPASSAIDPAERAAALAHLAGCARCQVDQAADARLDAALRRAFSPRTGAAPLRTRDLLLAIGATHEPTPHITVAPARGAASPIRSVVNLGDFEDEFEGGFERMGESDEATRAEGTITQAAPTSEVDQAEGQSTLARKMATIPSLRPTPRQRGQVGRPSSQALAMGFSATAAAVILIVIAATLFASRDHAPANTSAAHHVSATATAQAQLAAIAPGPLYAIAMDSPTDGWAAGSATPQQPSTSNSPVAAIIALYHYDGRQWTFNQHVKDANSVAWPAGPISLTMLSPTDGWFFDGGDLLLRYDGTSWKPATITLAGNEHVTHLNALDFASSTDGFAAAYLNGGAAGSGAIGFLHYSGQQWTVDQTDISDPGLDLAHMAINRVFALRGTSYAWAIGVAPQKAATEGNVPSVGLVLQRVNGVWHIASELNRPGADTSVNPRDIYMASPTSGWIVGETDQEINNSEGTTINSHALLLRYDFHQYGNRWVPVNAPIAFTTTSDTFQSITANGEDNVWVNGSSSLSTINSGVAVYALLLHYNGSSWTQVAPSLAPTGVTSASVNAVSATSDGTLWCAGGTEKEESGQGFPGPFFCSYRTGTWSVTPFATK